MIRVRSQIALVTVLVGVAGGAAGPGTSHSLFCLPTSSSTRLSG